MIAQEEEQIIAEVKRLLVAPEKPAAPEPLALPIINEQVNRDACNRCDKRRGHNCSVVGLRCVEQARTGRCPLGRFPSSARPTETPERAVVDEPAVQSRSPLPLYIRENQPVHLQGLYRGKTAFLICGGPSFGTLDHSKLRQPGIITMGINNAPRTFRPNLWTHGDVPDNFIRSIWTDPAITKFSPLGLRNRKVFDSTTWSWTNTEIQQCPGVYFYKLGTGHKAENFLSGEYVVWGNTGKEGGGRSTFMVALRLLYELGFRRVFLLGADFRMDEKGYHFEQGRSRSSIGGNNYSYSVINDRCKELAPIFEKAGYKVFNCNPDSKLTAFPHVPYEQAVELASMEFGKIDTATERTAGLYDSPKPDPSIILRELELPTRYLTHSSKLAATRLSLPEPKAFNGAFIDTPQGKLLIYRTGSASPSLASCFVDKNLQMIQGSHRQLPLYRNDDPRLIYFKGELMLVTSYHGDGFKWERVELRRVKLGSGYLEGLELIAKFEHIENDPAYVRTREKNWTPFIHEDTLYFVQWVQPHRVLRYDAEKKSVALVSATRFVPPAGWPWEWSGELRLNTNPVRLRDGNYLSVFHTWVRGRGYYNGFYVFEGKAPFRILKVSARPFTNPWDATGKNPHNNRNGVIFLQTLVVDEERGTVRVTGGDNDHSVIAFDLMLADVMRGLVDVETFKPTWVPQVAGHDRCVMTAADLSYEWMLPWWFKNLRKHSDLPVIFADWGMSPAMVEWCRARGEVVPVGQEAKGFISLRKPSSLLRSSFTQTLWMDCDVEVRGDFSAAFQVPTTTQVAAAYDDPDFAEKIGSPNHIQAGVVMVNHGSELVTKWATHCSDQTFSIPRFRELWDQGVLNWLVERNPVAFTPLPKIFNWVHTQGENPHAVLLHWAGAETKERIREWAKPQTPTEAIDLLDDTNPITTARSHLMELYERCHECKPASILELGCGLGTSGVAVGLGAPEVTAVMVDDEKEVPREQPLALWRMYSVKKSYVKSDVGEFLRTAGHFDFVFHDAGHGPNMTEEYRRCWELTDKVLAIHDAEKIDWPQFLASLPGVQSSSLSLDAKGRALGIVCRQAAA